MALQVWLPLNGTLENKGLSNTSFTVSGTTSYADGKIGKGLSCNGSSYWASSNLTIGTTCSICWWAKTSTGGKMPWVLEATVNTNLNFYYTGVYCLNTGDSALNPFLTDAGSSISVITDNVWHHFAVVFDGSKCSLYIDGTYRGKAKTYKSPATSNKRFKVAGGYNNAHSYDFNGMLNDVRLYNHALSPKEVKEISKGLILHYKLDGNDIGITIPRNGGLIPDGVELYDYILSSGTLYIDTGWITDYTKSFEVISKYNASSSGSRGCILSAYNAGRATSLEVTTNSRFWLHDGNIDNNIAASVGVDHTSIFSYGGGTWKHQVDGGTALTGDTSYSDSATASAYMFLDRALRTTTFNKTFKIYYLSIKENGVLIRNFIPCTYLGEPGMWDTVENKFYRNQGTGQFTLGNKITLKEYEYLEGDGSSYIDTNVILNNTTANLFKILFDAVLTKTTLTGWRIYGYDVPNFSIGIDTYNKFCIEAGGLNRNSTNIDEYATQRMSYFVDIPNKIGTLTTYLGEIVALVTPKAVNETWYNYGFRLFGTVKSNGTSGNITCESLLYSCKMYINDILIRDFIPCSYNGTPGLWDKVEWKFYGNAGSGSFTLGPEITVQQDAPIFYDSSGYCNHGSITGTLTTNNDSPRYKLSTLSESTSSFSTITYNNFKLPDGPITVSFWSKPTISLTEDTSKIDISFSNCHYFTYMNYIYFVHNGDYKYKYVNPWSDNKWHFIVGSFNGTNTKIYVDGNIIDVSSTSSSDATVFKDNLMIKLRGNNLSDFRIYVTALSDEDILELYNTSAFVTDNGVFAEYELYEDNLSDVKKTGLLETANFYENGAESGYALDTDKTRVASNYIISEDFIEI